jgi:hypothetical protein
MGRLQSTTIAFIAIFVLSGCGGGGSSVSGSVSTPIIPNLDYYVQVAQHQSGQKVFLGNELEDGKLKAFAALMPSEQVLKNEYVDEDGSPVNILYSSYFGTTPYGDVTKVVASSNGQTSENYVYFHNGTNGETDFVGKISNGVITHLATGDKLTSIPSGTFTYRGGHFLFNDGFPQSGTFTMNVNFTSGSAALQANTSTYSVSANDIVIGSSGQFESNNLTVENLYSSNAGSLKNGELDGTFTGAGALGVVGVYSSSDGRVSGTFSGSK